MKDYVLRQNVVVISGSSENERTYLQALGAAIESKQVAQLKISCANCYGVDISSIARCLIQSLLEKVEESTKVGCLNLPLWLKYRKENRELSELIVRVSQQQTLSDIYGLLSREHENANNHIRRLLEMEQKEYLIVIVSEFSSLSHSNQPIIASLLHRLVKGAPAYFQIISTEEPNLFKKDDMGEVGIQVNHDYVALTL